MILSNQVWYTGNLILRIKKLRLRKINLSNCFMTGNWGDDSQLYAEWKQLFKCSWVKEKPQTSLLGEMKHRISINSYCLKSIFPGVCLQNSSSFNIHRKMNTLVLDLKLFLNSQAKTGPMKNRTRLSFQSGKHYERCPQPLYDLPLLRLFFNKKTLSSLLPKLIC